MSVNKRFHRHTSNQRIKEQDHQYNEIGTVLGTKNYEEKPRYPTNHYPNKITTPKNYCYPKKTLLPQTTLFLTQHSFDDGVNKRIGG